MKWMGLWSLLVIMRLPGSVERKLFLRGLFKHGNPFHTGNILTDPESFYMCYFSYFTLLFCWVFGLVFCFGLGFFWYSCIYFPLSCWYSPFHPKQKETKVLSAFANPRKKSCGFCSELERRNPWRKERQAPSEPTALCRVFAQGWALFLKSPFPGRSGDATVVLGHIGDFGRKMLAWLESFA